MVALLGTGALEIGAAGSIGDHAREQDGRAVLGEAEVAEGRERVGEGRGEGEHERGRHQQRAEEPAAGRPGEPGHPACRAQRGGERYVGKVEAGCGGGEQDEVDRLAAAKTVVAGAEQEERQNQHTGEHVREDVRHIPGEWGEQREKHGPTQQQRRGEAQADGAGGESKQVDDDCSLREHDRPGRALLGQRPGEQAVEDRPDVGGAVQAGQQLAVHQIADGIGEEQRTAIEEGGCAKDQHTDEGGRHPAQLGRAKGGGHRGMV